MIIFYFQLTSFEYAEGDVNRSWVKYQVTPPAVKNMEVKLILKRSGIG